MSNLTSICNNMTAEQFAERDMRLSGYNPDVEEDVDAYIKQYMDKSKKTTLTTSCSGQLFKITIELMEGDNEEKKN